MVWARTIRQFDWCFIRQDFGLREECGDCLPPFHRRVEWQSDYPVFLISHLPSYPRDPAAWDYGDRKYNVGRVSPELSPIAHDRRFVDDVAGRGSQHADQRRHDQHRSQPELKPAASWLPWLSVDGRLIHDGILAKEQCCWHPQCGNTRPDSTRTTRRDVKRPR